MTRIIRVFPRRTNLTPTDQLAFVGDPPLWLPTADEVHVSCTLTWDLPEADRLRQAWAQYYPVVRIGGPALDDPCNGFTPGMYVGEGVTFTTRGCNRQCPWCLVPKREGRLRELGDFAPGWIVQDNNLLQASAAHIRKVFAMLRSQRRAARFVGGLQVSRVTDSMADDLRGLRIDELYLAADTRGAIKPLGYALDKLKSLGRRKLRVYALIGYDYEALGAAEARLEAIWDLGGLPFAQLYQPADRFIEYSSEWTALARKWSRPAAMFASHNAPSVTGSNTA